jgi:hypothetical protein
MTKDELITWLQFKGWSLDNFGHYRKHRTGHCVRFCINDDNVFIESKASNGDWIKVLSNTLEHLCIINDKLMGMRKVQK